MQKALRERWSVPMQLLHWSTVVLILVIGLMGLIMVDLPRGDATRSLLYATHKSLGVTVLMVILLRILVRCITRVPGALLVASWQRRLADLTHLLMYGLLITLPLSGWLLNSVAGQPLSWFGLIDLPALAAKSSEWRATVDTAHVVLFWSLIACVVLHVLAVVHHQFVRRDRIMQRMISLARKPAD